MDTSSHALNPPYKPNWFYDVFTGAKVNVAALTN